MTAAAYSGLAGLGASAPAWVLRAVLGALLIGLAALHLLDAWGWVAAVAALAAVTTPWVPLAWVAMLSLALSELVQRPGAAVWHPYVMLAGLALAQVLAARVAITPVRARVALRIFVRPLLTAAVIVAPCEGLLALTLWLRTGAPVDWLPAAVVAALALFGLGALLFARLLRTAE